MKKLLILALLFASCQPAQVTHRVENRDTLYTPSKADTVFVQLVVIDSTIIRQRDSILQELYVCRYKIERVKHYIAVTEKNPNNKSFFFGWIKRAVQ